MIKWIKEKYFIWKKRREFSKKLKKLKKQDPFTYKNF